MAARWSSECFTAVEHRDLQANAMAVDNTGTYVLLAGRRYIAIRNLDDMESESVRKFPRQSKYEVGSAEWNPTSHHSELCVISCNQRLEVLTWHAGGLTQTHSLRAHTRVITDLNWHRSDPNILASCSADAFIHCWDLRDSRRPSMSLSAVAEATQVRWNCSSQHLLATAHDGDIKIWDQRKGTAPIHYIAAHLSKIHGLDWSPINENQLVTSSQDNTVKFFDTNNPRRAEYTLNTNAPVWRARYTPFGNGLVTVVVPQLRRGENSLLLWNIANRATPVHTFIGHRDVVLEFEWRKQRQSEADFQLITWSKDQTLLIWRIEPFLQKLCGHEPEEPRDEYVTEDALETISNASTASSIIVHPLNQEFSLLNVHIPNLEVLKMDPVHRFCTVRASTKSYFINIQVSFPNTYPHGVPPTFQMNPGSTIDESKGQQVLQTLTHIAQQRVLKNRTCLEPCLRQLVATLEQLTSDAENNRLYDRPYMENPNVFESFNDAYIPFPRTSGARFCSVSILVCFGRPIANRRLPNKLETTTPRALSALGNVFGTKKNDVTISNYYYQKQRSRSKHNLNAKSIMPKAFAVIYDASALFYVNKQLGANYTLDGDIGTICKHNAIVAASVGRLDLVQAWTLAELVASPQKAEEDLQWSIHPFGNQLVESLITHYAKYKDMQMAAMLCCIFGKDRANDTKKNLTNSFSIGHLNVGKRKHKNSTSPYHTIPPADVVADGWVFALMRSNKSNSYENLTKIEEILEQPLGIKEDDGNDTSHMYEYYKLSYAENLYRWGLLYNRAEVLKYMCTPVEQHKGVVFLTDCKNCLKTVKNGCSCRKCSKPSLNCVICHISVRGLANCCIVCGHGGHMAHLQQWFAKNNICPSGCGCNCLNETANLFKS